MIRLELKIPESPPTPMEFDEAAVIIGRSNDATMPIQDPKASRIHCQIVKTSNGLELVDMNSSNGTLVNGQPCRRCTLTAGDKIKIGNTVITFTGDGRHGAGPAPSMRDALAETPPAGTLPPPPAPARPAHPALRPSSTRLRAARPSSHILPLMTFLAIACLFGGGIYFIFLRAPLKGPDSATSALRSNTASGEGEAWWEFERLDAERRAEQKRREEEIIRTAEERRLRERSQADHYATEAKRLQKTAEAETRRKTEEAKASELARMKAEAESRAERRAAEASVFAGEKKRFRALEPLVDALLKKFEFEIARDRIREFQAEVKTEAGVELAVIRADEISAMAAAFEKMWKNLESGDEIKVRERTIRIRSSRAEGFTGAMGKVTTTQKWSRVPPEDLVDLFSWIGMTAEDRYGLGLLCFELGLQEAGEYQLARCVKRDPGRKLFLDLLVARVRGVEPPPGGFIIHLDQWVTPKEKTYIDQGKRRYKGKWMTEEEINEAKGLVKVGDAWMTPAEAKAKKRREDTINKYKLKEYIDREGYYDGKPWSEAITIETPHYKIKSNLKPEAVKDAANIMEWLNYNFRRAFNFQKRMQKFEVWIGGSRQDYRTHGGGGDRALGHCSSGGVLSTFSQPPITTLVLMHEGTHQFIFRIAPTCPLWMHEGMATFFECSKFKVNLKRRELVLRTGLLNRNRLMTIQRSIRDGSVASMDDFIHGRKGDPYSQGWAFVYYIVNAQKGRYARYWLQFLKDVGKGNPTKWFKKWLGVRDLKAFEEDWKKFIIALDPMKGEDQKIDHK